MLTKNNKIIKDVETDNTFNIVCFISNESTNHHLDWNIKVLYIVIFG